MRFILYVPKGVKTGGPEAIHQLNHALKDLGFECYLLATWGTGRKKTILEYNIYRPKFIQWWSLKRGDVVVVPEFLSRIPYYVSRRADSIVFWWLSVDNSPFFNEKKWKSSNKKIWSEYPDSKDIGETLHFRRHLSILSYLRYGSYLMALRLTNILYKLLSSQIKLSEVLHIFQSNYAKEYVGREYQLKGLMVSDYTHEITRLPIQESQIVKIDYDDRAFIVAYNPRKGLANILNIKRFLDPSVKFIPLQGFSDNQVQDILNKVDLYLDLGNLPGKDRLPREAIMAGCPIMITTLGAGFNAEDFPVPSQYKLQLDVISPVEAAQSVLKVLKLGKLENFKMQTLFRESVSKEKEFFYREVREFVRQFTGS
jgi:hypothetical protein